jgi:GPH family glycoside/pentoside/hexuronide:cation symporter
LANLSLHTKFAYGIGNLAERLKNTGFDTFLFFYFTQVMGLSGSLAGIAILIALLFDAITDPLIGSLSDNWKGRGGRRHFFLYAAALPLAISYIILFNPPASFGQIGLFIWLTAGAIAVRAAMTLYHVPYLALGAELSDDYHERTSIVSWRTVLGFTLSAAFSMLAYLVFFPESAEFENGMLNPEGYPQYALIAGVIMMIAVWYSAFGTRDQIARLSKAPDNPAPLSVSRIWSEFSSIWGNVSFRAIFLGSTAYAAFFGVIATLGTHMSVFFWELSTSQLPLLILPVVIGFIFGSVLVGPLHKRFDKMPTLIGGCVIVIVSGNLPVVLRLLGMFPENGSSLLLPTLVAFQLVTMTIAGVNFVSAGSMMADVAEEHTLNTGEEKQGIIFSALSFSGKFASGFGHFAAGVGLDLIAFPLEAEPSTIPDQAISSLGVLSVSAVVFSVIALRYFGPYSITLKTQLETRQSLGKSPATVLSAD